MIEEHIELSNESKEAIEALKPKKNEDEICSLTGKIIAAEVTRSYVCINFKYQLHDQNNSGAVVKCSSCNLSMLKQNMPANVMTNIIITKDTGESAGRYICPMKVLDSLFGKLATLKVYNIAEKEVANLSLK